MPKKLGHRKDKTESPAPEQAGITYLVLGASAYEAQTLIRHILRNQEDSRIIILGSATKGTPNDPRVICEEVGCEDKIALDRLFTRYAPDYIVSVPSMGEHHIQRDLAGLAATLEVAYQDWEDYAGGFGDHGFIQLSLQAPAGADDFFAPTVAAAELFVKSFAEKHAFPASVIRAPYLFGPGQPEGEFIPSCVLSSVGGANKPTLSKGAVSRSWTYADDFCRLVLNMLKAPTPGAIYASRGQSAFDDETLSQMVIEVCDRILVSLEQSGATQLDVQEPQTEGEIGFEDGLAYTIAWYLSDYLNSADLGQAPEGKHSAK